MKEIKNTYSNQFANYEAFTKRLEDLLKTILKESNINYHLVESRTKTVESFGEKIKRKQEKYTNPLVDITDICGLRIIVFYITDLEKVEKLIKETFLIDISNSIHTRQLLSDNQFGYLSSHYVISLKRDRGNLIEWKPYKSLKAEIQVRTVLQHAWASISHELEYKKTLDIPSILKRKLFRLSGLFELVDEEFQVIKERHKQINKAIANKQIIENIKVYEELNLDTLKFYFETKNIVLDNLKSHSIAAGFEYPESESLEDKKERYLSEIISISRILGIYNIKSFDDFLAKKIRFAKPYLSAQYKGSGYGRWRTNIEFTTLLFLLHFLTEEQFKELGNSNWQDNIWERVKAIALKKTF